MIELFNTLTLQDMPWPVQVAGIVAAAAVVLSGMQLLRDAVSQARSLIAMGLIGTGGVWGGSSLLNHVSSMLG